MPMSTGGQNMSRATQGSARPVYYVGDLSKATFVEIWQVTEGRPRDFLRLSFARLVGKPIRVGVPIPSDEATIVDLHEVPEDIRRNYDPLMKPLLKAGFTQK